MNENNNSFPSVLRQVSKSSGVDRDILEHYFLRPISAGLLTIFGRHLNCSPNVFTSLSIVASLIAGIYLYQSDSYTHIFIGVIIMNTALFLDSFDGAYARFKNKGSEFGAWYDSISDCLKYIILLIPLTIGCYYHLDIKSSWVFQYLPLQLSRQEMITFMGLWIISNLFITYCIHLTRYQLSFNPGNMATLESGRFYIGIESLLYTLMTIFLLTGQVIPMFVFLTFFTPILWLFPFWKTYQHRNESKRK